MKFETNNIGYLFSVAEKTILTILYIAAIALNLFIGYATFSLVFGFPLLFGVFQIILLFKKKNLFGNISIILTLLSVPASWFIVGYLENMDRYQGMGGLGLLAVIAYVLAAFSYISAIFALIGLFKIPKPTNVTQ
jgi:hypothetical protein